MPLRNSPPPCGRIVRLSGRTTMPPPKGWQDGWPVSPMSPPSVKRVAGIKGDVDHFAALSFLRGLLLILKDSGYSGLVLVLDEIETLQRVRGDVREKGLNALRQLIDDIDSGRFPNLYLLITGTPAFFDGPQGIRRLEPLAQRLHVDFQTDARFDNPRAVQLRLSPFDHDRLVEVGIKVRDLYLGGLLSRRIGFDAWPTMTTSTLWLAPMTGKLGGKVGIAPRLFLKKLVSDVLDRIDQFDDFDPRKHYQLTINANEMTAVERESQAQTVDDIELGFVNAFERLHPALQHHIVNSLGWRELREVQALSIDAFLDGANLVILAPTAGGKTEAAFFPVISQMLTEHWDGLSVLYVSPIKAS